MSISVWQLNFRKMSQLQEVAGNHGVALWGRTDEGFATDPVMVAMHLIFAATRIQIEMTKYPKWYASCNKADLLWQQNDLLQLTSHYICLYLAS